jgi:hypothetical protein
MYTEARLRHIQREHRLTTHTFDLVNEIWRLRGAQRCVDNSGNELSLTVGEIYDVQWIANDVVFVRNDRGVEQTYHVSHFERV